MDQRSAATATASPTTHLFTAQQAALAELMTGMDADSRWVLLLGAEGSGKSTVIRALLDELRLAAATVAVFEDRAITHVDQLVRGLREQLGLPRKRKLFGDDHSVADIVASQSAGRTPLVVVVDDADSLSAASIKWLAGLAASASRTHNACYVVLAGRPALEATASRAWARHGSGHASVRSMLRPMTPAEVHRYVEEWTSSASDASVKFSEAAIQRIETFSKGRPALIGRICARAVTSPATRLTNQVSVDAVVESAERLGLGGADSSVEPDSEIERPRRRVARRAALAIGTATIAALLVYVGPVVIRVAPGLIATSASWLGLSGTAVDRSTSETARSRREDGRRAPGVTSGRGAAAPTVPSSRHASAAPTVSSSRPEREPQSAARTPRPLAVEPSAAQVAALMAFAREGDVDQLTRLVSGGVSPNVRDVNGFTPLMAAVVNDRVSAARVLLDRGAQINARTRGGLTALMLGIINDRPDTVTLLLERGADINAQSGAGWTALSFAAWRGDAALVRTLLSHGARPNVIDKQGWKPFDYSPPKPAPTDSDPAADAERGSSEAASPNQADTR